LYYRAAQGAKKSTFVRPSMGLRTRKGQTLAKLRVLIILFQFQEILEDYSELHLTVPGLELIQGLNLPVNIIDVDLKKSLAAKV